MKDVLEDKRPLKMVRSSIACARCRRSKVKCVNNGPSSTCKACSLSNRECTYPVAGSSPVVKRSEALSGIKQEGEVGESKKRTRKLEDSGRRGSQKIGAGSGGGAGGSGSGGGGAVAVAGVEDVLDSPILTRKVWDELFELFKMHFATEMPFLHPPTFRTRMRQAAYPRDPSTSPAELEEGRVLLLGVLTLTARFHSGLVAHHSPNVSDPLAASEYYAGPLATAFGPTIRHLSKPSIENVQALLMLGLYDWGQTRGLSAWLNVGLAIRLAFSMGLAYLDDPDNHAPGESRKPLPSSSHRDVATEKEVRRRTFWSCFIMDRMLSAGKNRPVMITVERLAVQLPCSDDQFLFVQNNVQTSFLSRHWMDRTQTTNDDGVLSRYMRLVEIFGDLSVWSYAGGRRTETLPPWNEGAGFFQLRRRLEEFHDALPSSLTLTDANLSAHIEKRNATTYASLHTLYSLCLIVIHREYIPFIPIRCTKPAGPLDEPTFPSDKFDTPEGFWEESAIGIMKASRDIINIVSTCQDSNALPESPQIGFAVWQAAFVCVYALWFPQMDTEGHLVDKRSKDPPNVMRRKGVAALTEKLLHEMVPTLSMVKGYLKSIGKMHHYFQTVYRDYKVKFKRGGGLEQYKCYERELKEFGELKDRDHVAPPSEGSDEHIRSRASTNDPGPTGSNGESMQGIEQVPQRSNGAWAPINASSPSMDDDRSKYTPHGQHPYGIPYQQQQPQQKSPVESSTTPPLVTLASESNFSVNSPYPPPAAPGTQSLTTSVSCPSASQYTMAPPTGPGTEDVAYSKWIRDQESISMNTGFDNFAQETSMESFTQTFMAARGAQNPNFFQATWAHQTQQGPAAEAGYSWY